MLQVRGAVFDQLCHEHWIINLTLNISEQAKDSLACHQTSFPSVLDHE